MEWGRKWLVWGKKQTLGLTFSSKLDWVPYIISIDKTDSNKIRTLICSMKFLSPNLHAWNTVVCAGDLSCYLELLDKLQKPICRTVGSSLADSLEPLAHHWNITSLSLFYKYIMFIWPDLTGSASLFSKEVYLFLFW